MDIAGVSCIRESAAASGGGVNDRGELEEDTASIRIWGAVAAGGIVTGGGGGVAAGAGAGACAGGPTGFAGSAVLGTLSFSCAPM